MRSPTAQLTGPLTTIDVAPTSAVSLSCVNVGVLGWPCSTTKPSRMASTEHERGREGLNRQGVNREGMNREGVNREGVGSCTKGWGAVRVGGGGAREEGRRVFEEGERGKGSSHLAPCPTLTLCSVLGQPDVVWRAPQRDARLARERRLVGAHQQPAAPHKHKVGLQPHLRRRVGVEDQRAIDDQQRQARRRHVQHNCHTLRDIHRVALTGRRAAPPRRPPRPQVDVGKRERRAGRKAVTCAMHVQCKRRRGARRRRRRRGTQNLAWRKHVDGARGRCAVGCQQQHRVLAGRACKRSGDQQGRAAERRPPRCVDRCHGV
eukprot:285926-Chlamydomonas_euryale.AAC.5